MKIRALLFDNLIDITAITQKNCFLSFMKEKKNQMFKCYLTQKSRYACIDIVLRAPSFVISVCIPG